MIRDQAGNGSRECKCVALKWRQNSLFLLLLADTYAPRGFRFQGGRQTSRELDANAAHRDVRPLLHSASRARPSSRKGWRYREVGTFGLWLLPSGENGALATRGKGAFVGREVIGGKVPKVSYQIY